MHFKLLVVFVDDRKTEALMSAARDSGATGCTVIHHARGEGAKKQTSFFGMALSAPRDVLLMIVEEHMSRRISQEIAVSAKTAITSRSPPCSRPCRARRSATARPALSGSSASLRKRTRVSRNQQTGSRITTQGTPTSRYRAKSTGWPVISTSAW